MAHRQRRAHAAVPAPQRGLSEPPTRTSCATRTRRTSASPSRRASPVRSPASPSTRSSRGCSRSTRRPAPAPSATGSARSCASRPTWWCPTATLSLKQGAVYPWAKTGSTSPYYEQTLEALAKHFKVSMSTPWEKLPKKVQDAILLRHRRGGGRLRLRGRGAALHQHQAVRGRDRQHRAPLPRDRQRLGARGALPLPGRAPLRCLRRLSPEAAGAGGEDRRHAHRPGRATCRSAPPTTGSPSCPRRSARSRPRSPPASSRRSASACSSWSTSGSTI